MNPSNNTGEQPDVLQSKEKILAKHTEHYDDLLMGALFNEDCITPKQAISAMQEYGEQIAAEIKKWNENYPAQPDQNRGEDVAAEEILKGVGIYTKNKEMWTYGRILQAMKKFSSLNADKATDMIVEDFYSGFNLDFLTEEEKQIIYIATELYAKGKVLNADKPDQKGGEETDYAGLTKGERLYAKGLMQHYPKIEQYQFKGDKCVPGCNRFSHYETKHHPDCPFYPNSLSEKYDQLESASLNSQF